MFFKNNRIAIIYLLMILSSMSFNFLSCYADSNVAKLDRRSQLYQFCFNHWEGK